MRRSTLITSIVGIVILASCSGGENDTADSTTPTTIGSTAPASTVAPTSTTEPTTPPTTSATTTTTTQAPPSTTAATAAVTSAPTTEEAIAAAAIASGDAYLYAVYNPEAPDAVDRLRATSTGASLQLGLENYQSIVDNGWRVRPNPDVPDSTTVASPVQIIDVMTAEVTLCEVGSGVVYAPGGNPDGSDLIINDRIEVSLLRVTMVLEDGVWKLSSGTTIEDLEAPAACDAY